MPRVVPNQKEKFETDEFMKRHSREGEVSRMRTQPIYIVWLFALVMLSEGLEVFIMNFTNVRMLIKTQPAEFCWISSGINGIESVKR